MSLAFFALLILCLLVLQATPYIPPGIQGSMVPRVILFPAQLVVAVVFWILTAWLSRTLTTLQIHSAALSERKTRIDRLRAVGALAAGLSHELATPLNTAKLKLNRMQRRPEAIDPADVDTAREALSRCEDVLRRMAGAQLRPEGVQLDVVDVEDLVEQVCRSFAEANRQAHVRFRAENGHPRFAQLPAVAFSQAMLNLIDNAVQSGGAEQPVDVVVGGRGGRVEVQVLDRGSGWPAVVRQHLGEPFVTTKSGGVGLGLYYVHTLAEAVGAQFSIEDREQGGAVVRISLRAAPALAEGAA